jgi:PAB-dependent poly(A)-specific ribonuclease subunit 2
MSARNARAPKASFSQILKSSVERETSSRGWCSRCQRYQSLATRKTIHSVPAVLMLNAAITTPDAKQFWATPGWLPEEIGVIVDQGQFFCYQGEDLKLHLQRGIHNITVYSLIGLAADIDSGQHQKSHLVSLVNGKRSTELLSWHILTYFSGALSTNGTTGKPVAPFQRLPRSADQDRRRVDIQHNLENAFSDRLSD